MSTYIIVGHYGSGKTEFAVNFAIQKKKTGQKTALADLDIANPYFRIREHALELEELGIHVVSNNLNNEWRIDLPALNSELESFFIENGRENIIDVGGNAEGARVLGRFRDQINLAYTQVWVVINANRYESQTTSECIEFINAIQNASSLKITGLINNTHMLRETTIEDILKGSRVTEAVSKELGIPCVYSVCPQELLSSCQEHQAQIPGELYPIKMYMRPNYL